LAAPIRDARHAETPAYPCYHTDMATTTDHEHPVDAARVRRARMGVIDAEDAARLSSLLALLGDPVRVRLLYALDLVEELCVGDLALALDITEDAASYGLRMLRTGGLVQTRKDGRVVYYRLADTFPEPLLEHCLRELLRLSELAGADRTRRRSSRPGRRSR
jgi:ArsR family transcriptional regulator, lead/cadmium/zinc/bismuth-responsive transcriptional repressor